MKVLLVFLIAVLAIGCGQDRDQASEVTQDVTTTSTVAKTDVDVAKTTDVVKTPGGTVFEYGIYNPQRRGRVKDSPETNTGKIIKLAVLEHSETTNRIPMVKGTYFAYRYQINNMLKQDAKRPAVEFRKVLIHPTMTLADGSTTNGWDRMEKERVSAGLAMGFDGYAFNEDYELVEGEWTFQIWYRDHKVIEQKFTTYRPEETGADTKAVAPSDENKI